MAFVRWTLMLVVLAAVAAALSYALPSREVVRIVGTEVRLETQTRTTPDGAQQIFQDDVYFIKTVEPDGSPRVYRNEDNGWYFKFDSANLDTQASNYVSTEADPRWVVVTHYGWRIPFFSMYPNAISMRLAEGPDEQLFPWLNIVLIVAAIVALLVLGRIIAIMRRRHVDPLVAGSRGRRGWWGRAWRGFGRR